MKVTKSTTLEKILSIPKSDEILAKYGVPCLSCPMASQEISKLKLGDVCSAYNLDLINILKDLNGKK